MGSPGAVPFLPSPFASFLLSRSHRFFLLPPGTPLAPPAPPAPPIHYPLRTGDQHPLASPATHPSTHTLLALMPSTSPLRGPQPTSRATPAPPTSCLACPRAWNPWAVRVYPRWNGRSLAGAGRARRASAVARDAGGSWAARSSTARRAESAGAVLGFRAAWQAQRHGASGTMRGDAWR